MAKKNNKKTPTMTTFRAKKLTRMEKFFHLYVQDKYSLPQIAKLLGVSIATVNRYSAHPDIRERMEREMYRVRAENQIDRDYFIQEYFELINSCKVDGKVKDRLNWNTALKNLAKLVGMNEPEELKLTGNIETIVLNQVQNEFSQYEEVNKPKLLNDEVEDLGIGAIDEVILNKIIEKGFNEDED